MGQPSEKVSEESEKMIEKGSEEMEPSSVRISDRTSPPSGGVPDVRISDGGHRGNRKTARGVARSLPVSEYPSTIGRGRGWGRGRAKIP